MRDVATQWDSAADIMDRTMLPGWISSPIDQLRVASYQLYDDIYRNVRGTFQIVARGTENDPIYIPSGKAIVEACNRYLAVGFDYAVTAGSDAEQNTTRTMIDKLFRRNKFHSKFATQKRWGLIRGDSMWHVIGDPSKADPFKRVQLLELDPSTCFAIHDPDDIETVTGWIIIKRMTDPAQPTRQIVRRQKYWRDQQSGLIHSDMNYYPEGAWDDRVDPETLRPYQMNVLPLNKRSERTPEPFDVTLDPRIDELPVYHIRNTRAPLDIYGSSEMAGIERIIAAVNQAISDEELSLALDGLGMYATTSGPPTDDSGEPVNWVLGPGRVVEHSPDSTFVRVPGVGSIDPVQSHLGWLDRAMRQASGTSDTAMGIVDVQVAQSGIALALQMAPLLAKNKEKEADMLVEYDAMFVDILWKWLPVYANGLSPSPAVDVAPVVGDAMPIDRASTIEEVTKLVDSKVITVLEAQRILSEKLGYEFTESSLADFTAQMAALAAGSDPFGVRMAGELVG